VTPIVGVLAGWLVLGERLTPASVAALALVASGIALVSWRVKGRG
jgi:drug/metabolite transporter (DMT)-like permease